MRTIARLMCVFCIAACFDAGAAFAEQRKFQIMHRQDDLTAGELITSGYLFVHVMNESGEDVKDLSLWVEGPNKVTFDNRVIPVGDLADGQPRGVLSEIRVPNEVVGEEEAGDQVTWKVQFTNASGEKVVMDVAEERIR